MVIIILFAVTDIIIIYFYCANRLTRMLTRVSWITNVTYIK